MPRKTSKRDLNWYRPRKGWTKTVKGKRYYFQLGECKGPDDREGYRRALAEYLALLDRLDKEEAQRIDTAAETDTLPNGSKLEHLASYTDYSVLRKKLGMAAGSEGGQSPAQFQTVNGLVNAYLEARKLLAASRQISQASYASDRYRLGDFLGYCNAIGQTRIQDVLHGGVLAEYRRLQLGGMGLEKGEAGYISPTSGKHRLRTVKACILWGHENTDSIDRLPKGLRTYAAVKIDSKRPQFFTVEEVRAMFSAAPPKMQACIALACNCGFTQADCSSLTHDMIDLEKGIVRKQRNKTGNILGQWKLWPVTLRLLREVASPDKGGPVLLTDRGQALVRESIKADGSPSKTDSVRIMFDTLRRRVDVPNGRTFKHLRKTASNMIRQQYPQFPYLYDQFLAHAPVGQGKAYTDPTFRLQDEATDWLGGQFAIG